MSFFKRLFNIGSAEANAALDKLEDPIKMTEQGIRDLKVDFDKSLQALAEVKAISIRTRKDYETQRELAISYEQKAMLLLQKAQTGELDPTEADRLATEALNKKEQSAQSAASLLAMVQKNDASVANLEQNVQRLKSQISQWENEAKTLKARAKVSEASQKINKHLANVDSNGTVAMLEKMKEKVAAQEALAESYGEMANASVSLDEEINRALGPSKAKPGVMSPQLAALKAKMGMLPPSEDAGTNNPQLAQ